MLRFHFANSVGMILLASTVGSSVGFCQTTTSIAGTVTGDDGKALAAVVTVRQTTASAASFRVQSAANGSFTIPNLAMGSYMLCAAVEQLGYVDPCEWSLQPSSVQLAASQAATGVKLVVKKGTTLRVHVDDPDKILGQTPAAKQVAPSVLLGVFTPGRLFKSLQLVNSDANGSDHQLLIPADDTPATFYIHGVGVQVVDQAGSKLDTGEKQISIKPRNGNAPDVINFTVRDPNKCAQ